MQSMMRIMFAVAAVAISCTARAEVKVEKVPYMNLPNCYKLSNGTVEAIVTTDVGPRIIRYGFVGGKSMLAEMPDDKVTTEWGDWKPLGGHRLWHAPEVKPRSYSPDNDPVKVEVVGTNAIQLTQKVEPNTGIQKEIVVTLDESGSALTVLHRLSNKGVWAVDLAPWGLTIMAGGGVTIIPQEPYKSHDDYVLPARPMVMWHYTDLSDIRWTIGKKFIRLRTDASLTFAQKVGVMNKQGWAAYLLDGQLFVKRFPCVEGATYPDNGCNFETFTKGTFMEVESVGPMAKVEPGASVEHVERWFLFRGVDAGASEATLDAAITPIISQTTPVK